MSRLFITFLTLFLLLIFATPAHAETPWHYPEFSYRLKITVTGRNQDLTSIPITIPLDPQSPPLVGNNIPDVNSIVRVASLQSPQEFAGYYFYDSNPSLPGAQPSVTFLINQLPAYDIQTYFIYFTQATDQINQSTEPETTPLLQINALDNYAGQPTFKITTPIGDYYYHQKGAAFASLIDKSDNDWISYSTANGAAGEYRGIPNMGFTPGEPGYMHPGMEISNTTIARQTPFVITLHSKANDNQWEGYWDIYPQFARFTLTKASHNFWFLYEGTPGGVFESSDTVTRSSGQTSQVNQNWSGDLPDPEWLYFSDPDVDQSLFLINLTDDNVVDSYKFMGSAPQQMTVFGFGRQPTGTNQQMPPSSLPRSFLIGLTPPNQANPSSYVSGLARPPVHTVILQQRAHITPEAPTATPTQTAATPTTNPYRSILSNFANIFNFIASFN